MSLETFDDFEDGDVSEWNVSQFSVGQRSFSGSFSGKTSINNVQDYFLAERSIGTKIDKIEYYWQETSNSFGAGVELHDGAGNRVCGTGTGNPAWLYTDGNSASKLYSGDGYNRWIKNTLSFDKANGNYTVTFKDLSSGTTRSTTASMDTIAYPSKIKPVASSSPSTLSSQAASFDHNVDMFWDEFSISPISLLKAPTNVSASVSSNDVSLSWDTASGASGYNILRAPSSGGSFSQIDSVGSGTTSFTDTGLQFNEDYAYKIESFN